MKSFTINNIAYQSTPFTFNTVRKLEDMGISLQEITSKPMSMICAYLSLCSHRDMDFAAEQIDAHICAGGSFDDILNVIKDEMEDSGFFQALGKTTTKTTTTGKKKATTE